jgi:hypothetical protein
VATQRTPLFVVGFPRSGTTLMQYLLNDHPDQAVAPETHFLSRHWRDNRHRDLTDPTDREAFWTEFTSSPWFPDLGLDARAFADSAPPGTFDSFGALFAGLLAAYADRTGKPRIGEKTPHHYQYLSTLFEWFPDARVIFMVRDPRAVTASYLTVDQSWAADADAFAIAARWARHVAQLNKWRADPRVHVVPYEQFVRDPSGELGRILSFAGLRDETAAILSRQPTQKRETGSLRVYTQVSDENIDAWRGRLSRAQVGVVEGLTRSHMRAFGYLPDVPLLLSKTYLAADRVRRRAHVHADA